MDLRENMKQVRADIDAAARAAGRDAHLEDNAYEGAQVHFIGHLQTNKVKYVVGRVELIHSISSEKLLRAVAAQADKLRLVQDILLEVNLAGEASKSGFSPQEALPAARLAAELTGVRLRGLMCIPRRPPPGGQSSIFSKITPVSC